MEMNPSPISHFEQGYARTQTKAGIIQRAGSTMGLCYDGDMARDSEISVKTSWQSRALALIEVCAVFGLAHLTYRAFKHFT
jgi:hypothetical protein